MSEAGTLVAYLIGGSLAGLVAAVAMDIPMSRQPDGWTPATVATAVLTRTTPDEVSLTQAGLVHHAIGVAAGGLYGAIALALAAVAPQVGWSSVPLVAHLLAVIVVTVFIYAFFAHLVFPRKGGTVYEEHATAVRGQWLRSSLVFAATLTVAGPPAIVLVGTIL